MDDGVTILVSPEVILVSETVKENEVNVSIEVAIIMDVQVVLFRLTKKGIL